jgi:hypothetical protein
MEIETSKDGNVFHWRPPKEMEHQLRTKMEETDHQSCSKALTIEKTLR